MKKLFTKQSVGISNYLKLYRKYKGGVFPHSKKLKVALLSSFTINGLKEVLFVKCAEKGIYADISVGPYGQHAQEILDSSSGLYDFNPQLIPLFIDSRSVLGDLFLNPYAISTTERRAWVEERTRELVNLIEVIKSKSSAKILFHNFETPVHSPMGVLEGKQEFGFLESVQELNTKIREIFQKDPRVFIFDFNSFCARIGKQNILDHNMYYMVDARFNIQLMPELADAYLGYIKPLVGLNRKCLVLDLDNTIWGGVVGEDGLEGIQLGPTPEGRSFFEFQKYILALFQRGIILAVNSKNNPEDALRVFREHPHMVLKERHFATMQMNWDDKVSNMRKISQELNIGMESMVFFDDDKLNCEMIRDIFPDMLVIDPPRNPSLYLKTITEVDDFNTFQITQEDLEKGTMYAAQRERKELQSAFTDINQYLEELHMVATIQPADNLVIPRMAQLTQKTNQFNMTTRRYQEEDLRGFASNPAFLIFGVSVEDKFGNNGLTGMAVVEKGENCWRIDTFLLSCRVIGRGVEDVMISHIINLAAKEEVKKIEGEFIQTLKNNPARNFYAKAGFQQNRIDGNCEVWNYTVEEPRSFPHFFRVHNMSDACRN